MIARYKSVVQRETKAPFPQEPRAQLVGARDAVFQSWMNPRAITTASSTTSPTTSARPSTCRRWCSATWATSSATGVGFTRNPSTGAKEFYGEFLQNAQGEDVVAGIRTPHPITDLEKVMPKAYQQLREITNRLERHYKDVQDFEFTIQENTLYMLQTRNGKRTGLAAVNIAVDMCDEGLISRKEALLKRRAAGARPAAAPDLRPEGQEGRRGRGQGPAGLARRGGGRHRVHRRRGGRLVAEGQARAAGPEGNDARRHPRHGRSRRASSPRPAA